MGKKGWKEQSQLVKKVIYTTVAIIGLVVIQTIYLRKEIKLANENFDHRAQMALKSILGELETHADTTSYSASKSIHKFKRGHKGVIFDVVDTVFLDTLFRKYVEYYKLDPTYHYAITKSYNGDIVYCSVEEDCLHKNTSTAHVCLSPMYTAEYFHLSIFFPNKIRFVLWEMALWLILSILFLGAVVVSFVTNILTILKQKKLTEMKNDFINNMTHEFKTPISTISLAADVLQTTSEQEKNPRIQKYSTIITEENNRLKGLVERVLQIAKLDRENIKLNISDININDIIQTSVRNLYLDQCEGEGNVDLELNAENNVIRGDELHINNVINNLVDNAVKYSNKNPILKISTSDFNDGLLIKVTDQGIGMTKEQQKQIFDKFYRVSTGNVHNVKGFGLGLYYVKNIVSTHQGWIEVESELNKGSTFTVFLPREVEFKNGE
jgi:two-component system phosphate regulon sensor histidine kinase PhoR